MSPRRTSSAPLARASWAVLPGAFAALALVARGSLAAEEAPDTRQMTQPEIEAWLDARALPGTRDVGKVEEQPEAPPPPPRRPGVVLESSLGAFGHLGAMKHVSPTSPWFHAQLGYEPFRWLMVFGESDLVFSRTSYASPPPDPRGYALYGFGGGVRFTVKPSDRFGIYAQGSLGVARVSNDVLNVYGYPDANSFNPYFGGVLGLEWYQISRHYALSVNGGVRDYPDSFARTVGSETPLAWLGGVALRYTF